VAQCMINWADMIQKPFNARENTLDWRNFLGSFWIQDEHKQQGVGVHHGRQEKGLVVVHSVEHELQFLE